MADQRSAFIKELRKHEAQLSEQTKQEQTGGYLDDEDVLKAFGIKDDTTKVVVTCRLTRVHYALNKKKKPFFQFRWAVAEGEHKNLPLSEYIDLEGTTKDQKEMRAKTFARLFQVHNVDTTKWPKNQIVTKATDAADKLTEEKPYVTIQVSAYKRKKKPGQRTDPGFGLNLNVLGLTDPPSGGGSSSDGKVSANVVSYAEMGANADNDELEEHEELQSKAEECEIDWSEIDSWEELGKLIDDYLGSPVPDDEEVEEADEESEADEYEDAEPDIDYEEYVGYECSARDVDTTVTTTSCSDKENGLFVVEDSDGTEMEFSFEDLDFGEGFGVPA